MKTRAWITACAAALLVSAPMASGGAVRAAHPGTSGVAATALPLSTGTTRDASAGTAGVAELSRQEMSRVNGEGFWKKVLKKLKKAVTWIKNNIGWIKDVIDTVREITSGLSQTYYTDRTDYYNENETQTDHYNEDGSLISSQYETTGELFQYSEVAGT